MGLALTSQLTFKTSSVSFLQFEHKSVRINVPINLLPRKLCTASKNTKRNMKMNYASDIILEVLEGG